MFVGCLLNPSHLYIFRESKISQLNTLERYIVETSRVIHHHMVLVCGGRHLEFALPVLSSFARIRMLTLRVVSILKSVLVQINADTSHGGNHSSEFLLSEKEDMGEVLLRTPEASD